MTKEDEEIEKAVEAVDKMEDEEAAKRKKAKDEYNEKDEDMVIICPKCMALVNEQDFIEDEVAEMAATSIATKINCSACGYIGIAVEMDRTEYKKMGKKK